MVFYWDFYKANQEYYNRACISMRSIWEDEMLNLSEVNKVINKKNILNNVNFSLESGKFLALLGPNGAGKTTIIRLITGLITQDSGEVTVLGIKNNSDEFSEIRKDISVQNDGNLYENLSIIENLEIWGGLYEIPKTELEWQITDLLNKFEIEDRKNSKVSELSKGMKQKILITRALLTKPKLLILDEPTSGLDPYMIDVLTSILTEYVANNDTTIIMATHQLLGLENIADDILILDKGNVLLNGATSEVIANYWSEIELDVESDASEYASNELYLSNSYNVVHVFPKQHIVRIKLEQYDERSDVIAKISNDIRITGINTVKHSVKELYFNTLGVEQAYE